MKASDTDDTDDTDNTDNKISEVNNGESNLDFNESNFEFKGWEKNKNENTGRENFYKNFLLIID